MANVISNTDAAQLGEMHDLYRKGGGDRAMAPHVIYHEGNCPHAGCNQSLHAIDFRLEAFGRSIHDPLVRAWWADTGFVGLCPTCHGWVHFTIRDKQALSETEAKALPQLPTNWADEAVIL
jgi:hypothetical protein